MLFFLRNSCNYFAFDRRPISLLKIGYNFLWEMDKLNMLADCLNFAFWSAFEEKWWLFHYVNDIEVFWVHVITYIQGLVIIYLFILKILLIFFFLFLSWSNGLFWCFLLYLNRPKRQSKLFLWMPLPLNWIKKANQNYFQEAIAKESNRKLHAWRWWKRRF